MLFFTWQKIKYYNNSVACIFSVFLFVTSCCLAFNIVNFVDILSILVGDGVDNLPQLISVIDSIL